MKYLETCPNPTCLGKGKEQPPLKWERKNCAFCGNQLTAISVQNSNRRVSGSGKATPSEMSRMSMKMLFRAPKGKTK